MSIPFDIPRTGNTAKPIFTVSFCQRVANGEEDGLMRLMPSVGSNNNIFFVNVPFTYKIIGMSLSLDGDTGGNKDYEFQLRRRPKDSGTTSEASLTAVGDIIAFDDVLKSTSRSALFTDPQTITSENDIGLRVDSTASGLTPEYGVILYCQLI